MALECKAWRAASDNSLHETAAAASEHDLKQLSKKLWASLSNTHQLEDRLKDNAVEVLNVLTEYLKHHPTAPRNSKGSDSSDGKKGPIKGDPIPVGKTTPRAPSDKFAGHAANCKARALNQLPLCDCLMSKISFSKEIVPDSELEVTHFHHPDKAGGTAIVCE